jgi:hypothetical protein
LVTICHAVCILLEIEIVEKSAGENPQSSSEEFETQKVQLMNHLREVLRNIKWKQKRNLMNHAISRPGK